MVMEKIEETNKILLSDGRLAEIKQGKGRHAIKAQNLSSGKQDAYMSILMAMLTTIDGKAIVPEDLEDLPLRDFTAIQVEFATQNFSSGEVK